MSNSIEVIMVPDDDSVPAGQTECREDGVEIPWERINPDTLRNLVAEFVSREWEELGDTPRTLDEKISQVMQQLKDKRAKVVFDLNTETCNIVPGDRAPH